MYAQDKDSIGVKQETLLQVLQKVEHKYEIKFSFDSDQIKSEEIDIPEIKSLAFFLKQIQKQTSLVFEKISDRYYVLKNKYKEGTNSLCGYLVDEETGVFISKAILVNKRTKERFEVLEEGYFEMFRVAPTDLIEINALGYVKTVIKANSLNTKKCRKLWVPPIVEELSEVVITEYLTSGVTREEGGAVKITPNQLGILPRLIEPDVLQTIQFLPGIQSPTETASGLYIRSGTPDQNLILWDGITMYHSGHFFGLLSAFNPYIIDHVNVSRSGTEAKYGGRVSGVIDIVSKSEIPQRFSGGGGINMTHADAYANIPVNSKLGLIFSSRRAFTDFIETITYNQFSERVFQNTRIIEDEGTFDESFSETNNLFYFLDSTFKAIYEPDEKNKWTFSGLHTRNSLNYIAEIGGIVDGIQDVLNIENQGLSVTWEKEIMPELHYNIRSYISNYDLNYLGINTVATDVQDKTFKENVILDAGIGFDLNWKINKDHKVSGGYHFSSNNVSFLIGREFGLENEDSYQQDRNIENLTHAMYSEYRYQNNAIKLNVGIRGNYFSELNRFSIEPRINTEINLFKNTKARITAERKEQVISQVLEFETRDFGLENQVWVLSGEDFIPVQKGYQFSGGILYSNHGWDVDIESYYKNTKGLTSFTRGFNISQSDDPFIGSSEAIGIDFLIKKRIENYRSWVSYSFAQNLFTFDELNNGESFFGNFDVRHSLSWSHSYQWNNFEASLGWNFRTGIPYTPADGVREVNGDDEINYGEVNSARLASYHRLDMSASYKFSFRENSKWRGKIGFSLLNLYNRENELSRVYELNRGVDNDINTSGLRLREVNKTSLGITPNLVFRIDF